MAPAPAGGRRNGGGRPRGAIEVKGKSAHAASPQYNIEGDFEISIELPDKYLRQETPLGGGMMITIGLLMLTGAWDRIIQEMQVWSSGFTPGI